MNSMASRVFSLASTPAITVSPGGTSTGSSFGAARRRVGISFRSDDRTGQDRTGETALAFGGPPGMWKRAEALVAQQKAQPSGHDARGCEYADAATSAISHAPGCSGRETGCVSGPDSTCTEGGWHVKCLWNPQQTNKRPAPGPSVSCSTGSPASPRAPLRRPLGQRARRLPDSACRAVCFCARQATCCCNAVIGHVRKQCGIAWRARYGSSGYDAERRNSVSCSAWLPKSAPSCGMGRDLSPGRLAGASPCESEGLPPGGGGRGAHRPSKRLEGCWRVTQHTVPCS